MTLGALIRYTAAVAAIGIAVLIGVAVGRTPAPAFHPAPAAASAKSHVRQPPLVQATRPVIRHTRGEVLAWQAKLRKLELAAGGQALAAGPLEEALVYDRAGRAVVRVTAQGVRGRADQRNFIIEGPVQAVAERGAILQASRVEWRDEEAKLYCVGPVTVRFRNALLTTPEADLYVERDVVVAPRDVRLTVGTNLVIGHSLTYNISTQSFSLSKVRMILHAEEAKQQLRDLRQ